MKKKSKPASHDETRKSILKLAKAMKCETEVKQIFEKYDNILKQITNPIEYQQIATLGLIELHKFLDCRGPLVVNGQEILPGDPNSKDIII